MPLNFFVTLGCLIGVGALGIREQIRCLPDAVDIKFGEILKITQKIEALPFEEKYKLYVEAYGNDPPAMAYCPKDDPQVEVCMERKIFDKVGLTWGKESMNWGKVCFLCMDNGRKCSSLYNCLISPYIYNNMDYYDKDGVELTIKRGRNKVSEYCHVKNWEGYYGKDFVAEKKRIHKNWWNL